MPNNYDRTRSPVIVVIMQAYNLAASRCLVYDGNNHRSDLVILDASNLNRRPGVRLHLKHHVPYGLHGSFTPNFFGVK